MSLLFRLPVDLLQFLNLVLECLDDLFLIAHLLCQLFDPLLFLLRSMDVFFEEKNDSIYL